MSSDRNPTTPSELADRVERADGARARRRDYLVTVCDACQRACCWHGLFYCEDYQTAGTKDVPASQLRKLKAEHSSYYSARELMRVCGGVTYLPALRARAREAE